MIRLMMISQYLCSSSKSENLSGMWLISSVPSFFPIIWYSVDLESATVMTWRSRREKTRTSSSSIMLGRAGLLHCLYSAAACSHSGHTRWPDPGYLEILQSRTPKDKLIKLSEDSAPGWKESFSWFVWSYQVAAMRTHSSCVIPLDLSS
jgi:hypothetical protein